MTGKINSPHVLLVIRHPVGGIRTYIKYIYTDPYFSSYRFTVITPESDLPAMNRSHGAGPAMEYRICKGAAAAIMRETIKVLRKEKVDLIHAHGFTSGICSVFPARLFSAPLIMTAHDVLLEKQFAGLRGKMKRFTVARLFRMIDVIHAVSYDVSANIRCILPEIRENNLVTITNGITISQYEQQDKIDYQTEYGISRDCYKIGFLGRFMSQKGFRYLIDAVELLIRGYHLKEKFVVIALGSGGFIREETDLIYGKGLRDSFLFLPPAENVAPYIHGMDVVVMPSLWEASGLVAMETLVSGIPLIASDCIGLREVISGSPAFVVEPANAKSLAKTIVESMRDNRLGEFRQYQQTARERFDAAATSRQLKELYEGFI